MKKSIMIIGISTFMVYNIIPIINLIFPKSIRYTFLIDLWIINNLWALIVSIFFLQIALKWCACSAPSVWRSGQSVYYLFRSFLSDSPLNSSR